MLRKLRKKLPDSVRRDMRRIRAHFLSLGLPRKAEFSQPEEERSASAAMSVVVPFRDLPVAVFGRCLGSLVRYAPGAEVILVDDGSVRKETPEFVKQFLDRQSWKLVRNEKSLGHSRATEAGARLATRPYLCLLNSDAIVTPWSWLGSQEAFEADPKIGICGPTTSQTPTPQMSRRAELCRHFWTDSQIFGFAEKSVKPWPPRTLVELPEVGGFAFFIRRTLWEQLEGFAPDLPDYGNEFELCRRALLQGSKIVWTKRSYIHHLGQQDYIDPTSEWL
jgi:GT2 family glycosyltransferase